MRKFNYYIIQRLSKTFGWQPVFDWDSAGFFYNLRDAAERLRQLSTVRHEPHRIKMFVKDV